MEDVQYLGELLWPGKLAHFLILLSFFSAAFSAYSYYRSTNEELSTGLSSWKKLGRGGFVVHSVSVFSLIGIIFMLMIQQRFEYAYVFQHVSPTLPIEYIFSAFWEGQEGSFLLWMFWHAVLGLILMWKAKEWESPVVSVLALIQVLLASMITGLHIGFGESIYKLGINPTLLLRDTMDAPIFAKADYLNSIKDSASGLNPLLQNYWMTIHPPTLFLGFASTAVPFCFAIAGLWTQKHKAWLKPALSWSLFSAFILGTGILMGGAWAYEALTFGGYWAWDPVENMSLVPWIILIAGIHCHLVARATGYSIKSTYLFYILTFVLILYSTFLTRSGVLGETSVHSFTDLGLEWQLVVLVSFFLFLGLAAYFRNRKSIPVIEKEEAITSREFWMYIGALVLLFSGCIIAYSTSLPVYNRIMTYFDPAFTGRVINDPVPHYNKYQIWIAVFVSILSSVALFFNYRKTNFGSHFKKSTIAIITSAVLAAIITYFSVEALNLHSWQYVVLALCSIFAILLNLYYLFIESKRNLKLLSSGVSHFGFAAMILGIIFSGLNESVITKNPFAMQGLIKDENLAKSVNLIKGEPMFAEGYWMTYNRDTVVGNMRKFEIDFRKVNEEGHTLDEFTLFPNVLYSNDFQKVAASNPSTKHFWNKDIFTNISSLPKSQMDAKFAREMEDTIVYLPYEGFLKDTIFTKQNFVVIKNINNEPTNENYVKEGNDFGIELELEVGDLSDKESAILTPAIGVKDNLIYNYPGIANDFNIKVKLAEVVLNEFFTPEESLVYDKFVMKEGEVIDYKGFKIRLVGFNREITNDRYKEQEGDLAIAAILNIQKGNNSFELSPVFVVRDMNPMNIKDYQVDHGLHANFTNVNPQEENYTLYFAQDIRQDPKISLQIAENVPRTDFISLEAKTVPGINLFWLGSILMLLGFLFGMLVRLRRP